MGTSDYIKNQAMVFENEEDAISINKFSDGVSFKFYQDNIIEPILTMDGKTGEIITSYFIPPKENSTSVTFGTLTVTNSLTIQDDVTEFGGLGNFNDMVCTNFFDCSVLELKDGSNLTSLGSVTTSTLIATSFNISSLSFSSNIQIKSSIACFNNLFITNNFFTDHLHATEWELGNSTFASWTNATSSMVNVSKASTGLFSAATNYNIYDIKVKDSTVIRFNSVYDVEFPKNSYIFIRNLYTSPTTLLDSTLSLWFGQVIEDVNSETGSHGSRFITPKRSGLYQISFVFPFIDQAPTHVWQAGAKILIELHDNDSPSNIVQLTQGFIEGNNTTGVPRQYYFGGGGMVSLDSSKSYTLEINCDTLNNSKLTLTTGLNWVSLVKMYN